MLADFDARSESTLNAVGEELSVDTIEDYHVDVFGEFGVSGLAWTPFFPLSLQETPDEREAFWDELLTSGLVGQTIATYIEIIPAELQGNGTAWAYELDLLQASVMATLDAFNSSNTFGSYNIDAPNGGLVIGGDEDGNNNRSLLGGINDDVIMGFNGDDELFGNNGDDRLYGGKGDDTSIYEGAFTDYELEFLPNDSIRITDIVSGRDGSDLLKGVDYAQFSDRKIDLSPGQDIAFVIDTTASMSDDIEAVKADANDIINTIFDEDRGFIDSRIAVVGYNDPATNTFLSFTDQPKIEDRKTAAQNAINSISVDGGGDFPEAVNAGLIRALNGGAGEWREEAAARRIILFGDAPPKDTELRSEVLRLAADVGFKSIHSAPNLSTFSIAGDIETTSLSSELAVTHFEIETTDTDAEAITVPVEIFTVLIGNDSTTRTDFESLASATEGEFSTVATATDLVDVLIEAIESPGGGGNQAPVAVDDNVTTNQEIFVNIDVLANDSSPNGDAITIEAFDDISTEGGSVVLNDDLLIYTPLSDFSGSDSFTYRINDGTVTATATVFVEVGINLDGGNKKDELLGTPGDDSLEGGNGEDSLEGFDGNDTLLGGNAADSLSGGNGDDELTGGNGPDVFIFAVTDGTDVITDFEDGLDTIALSGGLTFDDLSFADNEITVGSDTLVILIGFDTTTLTEADFVTL